MLTFKRGRNRYNPDYKESDIYEMYCSMSDNPAPKKIFVEIIKELNCDKIMRMVVDGQEIYLPCRLGSMRVRKRKKKLAVKDGKLDKTKMPVKWSETKKMWEKKYPDLSAEEILDIPIEERGLIYNWNEHTDMYQFRFYWDKFMSNVPNRSLFVFRPTRNAKQILSKLLRETPEIQYKYFE